jgi:hypothetical protein
MVPKLYVINMKTVCKMFAVSFIHKGGGTKTVLGKTLKESRDKSSNVISKEYVAATIPYTVYLAEKSFNIYECTIPTEIMQELGVELRLLLKPEDDGK